MNYKKAYCYLFNQITDQIEALKVVQARAEELCILRKVKVVPKAPQRMKEKSR